MQEKSTSPQARPNKERSEETTAKLLKIARDLFSTNGFAATSTPQIVKAAGVTRGALYHHFADKLDLFRAVVRTEAEAVAKHIEAETLNPKSAKEALTKGAEAYFAAIAMPGRARLLLIEGPAVLGRAEMAEIDRVTGGNELKEGLDHAVETGALAATDTAILADLLSAAFDRAGLAISEGADARPYTKAIGQLLNGLLK